MPAPRPPLATAASSLGPATDGLRNIIGQVNRDGTVTIWGVTSTVSGGGDQGADPNKVVTITDNLGAQTRPAESFRTFESARSGEVLRGVSFTPGTRGRPLTGHGHSAAGWPGSREFRASPP